MTSWHKPVCWNHDCDLKQAAHCTMPLPFMTSSNFKLPLLVGLRTSQLDACTSMEHAHLLLYGDMVLQMSHIASSRSKNIMPKSYTNAESLSSPTYLGRAKNGLMMMNFTFQPLLHESSITTLFWSANWRRRSSQTSNNCRYLFLHTWVGSSLVDATSELATSEQENRIVTHSSPNIQHTF